jgi:Icc-related predicted phosphoesterase
MRIAFLVDVHDRFDAVPEAMREIGDVDLLIIGGDITTGGTPKEAARAIEGWLPLAPRLLALAGNMDSSAIDERLGELGVALDGQGVELGAVGVFGCQRRPSLRCTRPTS